MKEHEQSHKKSLGSELKRLRGEKSVTLAEIAGAVEVDAALLEAFEKNTEKPSEEVLILLIRYYELKGEKALSIWKLAGYAGEPTEERYFELTDDVQQPQPPDQLPPFVDHMSIGIVLQDPRVMYTDMAQVSMNDHGLVLSFLQTAGKDKPSTVARVGMSRNHTESLIRMLQKTLQQADAKGQRKLAQGTKKPRNRAPDTQQGKSSNQSDAQS